jgi:NADH-quinone oxidoreductase subunit K
MLQGVAINLVAFARYRGDLGGQMLVLFTLAVAACEAALALALVLALFKRRKTLDISVWQELREPDQDPIEDEGTLTAADRPEDFQHLIPAGAKPPTSQQTEEVSHV